LALVAIITEPVVTIYTAFRETIEHFANKLLGWDLSSYNENDREQTYPGKRNLWRDDINGGRRRQAAVPRNNNT
jgi:hypothetical protein